ncbi:hypothetical protein EBT16_11900, partial [bacterium]|nr:hypothetical protein [bacterium]
MVLLLMIILGLGLPSQASDVPSPEVMAHLTETLLTGSAQDSRTLKALSESLQELPQHSSVSQGQVERILKLFKNPKEPKQIAAAFFASQALIQASEASRILDTPEDKAKALETFRLIEEFSGNFNSENTRKVSEAVKTLSAQAGVQARKDLLASVLLQATNYVRRIEEQKLSPPVGWDFAQ